jgi:hypothetical protein
MTMTMSMNSGSAPAGGAAPKKMMKVLCPIDKSDGSGAYWIRVGTAFLNRDQSINLYLDVLPKNGRLQVRELDEDDLRERDPNNPRRRGQRQLPAITPGTDDAVPF